MPPKRSMRSMVPESHVKAWKASMQHVDRDSDSEEESVPDTQEQSAPPAQRRKFEQPVPQQQYDV